MATLSLNTSITSSHKDDFYSGAYNDGTYNWAAIINLYGNYFTTSGTPVLPEYMTFDGKVKGVWAGIDPGCDLSGYYSYAYCYFDWINAFYYDFSNPSNPNNYFFLEKIAAIYGGMSAESFVNRTTVSINVKDASGTPLSGVSVFVSCYDTQFILWEDKGSTTDINGNASITYFNPPLYPWNSSVYRRYKITASKIGYGTVSKDETIPNQPTYPSTGAVNLQLSACVAPLITFALN